MCPRCPSAFRGVLGWWADDVVDQRLGVVADVSPRWGGQATCRGPMVKAIGSKTVVHNATKIITEKEKEP